MLGSGIDAGCVVGSSTFGIESVDLSNTNLPLRLLNGRTSLCCSKDDET